MTVYEYLKTHPGKTIDDLLDDMSMSCRLISKIRLNFYGVRLDDLRNDEELQKRVIINKIAFKT